MAGDSNAILPNSNERRIKLLGSGPGGPKGSFSGHFQCSTQALEVVVPTKGLDHRECHLALCRAKWHSGGGLKNAKSALQIGAPIWIEFSIPSVWGGMDASLCFEFTGGLDVVLEG